MTSESSPLLERASTPSFRYLPRWFLLSSVGSVIFSLFWMIGLVILQHTPQFQPSKLLQNTPFNGSFLSASGYCCQKWAHHSVQMNPSLGTVSQQPLFVFGLFLLAIGTISAVLNLGILGQAVQAPFAAFTLVYSALLGHFVLHESFVLYDVLSSVLIVAGVAIDVVAAQMAHIPQQTYTLTSLGLLFFRNSIFPALYSLVTLLYTVIILGHVHDQGLHHRALGLLAFSSTAGIMAGFTSLATKSTLEVVKSAFISSPPHAWDMFMNPFFVLLITCIPSALIPQLYFLNKGLEHFGTLQFIPLYQAFVILGNMTCGMIFYNEMAMYSDVALEYFVGGIILTLGGVCLRLIKVETTPMSPLSSLPMEQPSSAFATTFRFEDIQWANDPHVRALLDFEECKQQIVQLLESATTSIYYSTFLCDFTQPLDPNRPDCTFLSCLKAAIQRGVQVHILYNPIVDYGTASVAHLQAQLPSGVILSCSTSDLGPSVLTRGLSNNSKYAFHHQKYLCIDASVVMVTGCDVNMERQGWFQLNGLGYYWHELSVITSCTRPMFEWIRRNHQAQDQKRHYDMFHESPPFPLVAGGWKEENAMILMILHARHSIQLENQILISGGSIQHNRVCAAIVERIARAVEEEGITHGFRVLILTNAAQQDEPSALTRAYCTISIQWSLEQLEYAAKTRGLKIEALYHALLIARMEASDGIMVKVHSNILITDGWYALRSSSNLADRSLSARPCDTELGVLFQGEAVVHLHQKLLNRYMGTKDIRYTLDAVICAARRRRWSPSSTCCLVPIEKKEWNPVMTWFLMHLFVFMSEGATGGRIPVTYETTTTIIGHSEKKTWNSKEAFAY